MSNLVIVAIPDENDHVWKISSEKVPHLTLLFLGEIDQVQNPNQIVDFVGHAANITLNRFYLTVDRRGELGDDKADVLFFKKDRYSYKAIRDFRAALLQDNNIKKAYDSAEQFEGPWNPHLTLGYPATPAKPDEKDYGFYSVDFNKISVWVDDYEGPEFFLKDYWDEYETLDAVPMDVAMSSLNEARVNAGLEVLEHHGVKGMRWGVRKVKAGFKAVGRGLASLGAHLAESNWQSSTYSDFKHEAVHNHVAKELDNRVERLQKSPKYRSKNLKADSDLRKEYYQDVAKVTESAYKRGVKEVYGENPSGTKTAHYVTDARGPRIEVRNKKTGDAEFEAPFSSVRDIQKRQKERDERLGVTHADTPDFPDLSINLTLDDNGQVSGVGFIKPSEDSLAQTVDLGVEFLEHHGIKGMQWGVRKETVPGPEGSHIRIGRSGRAAISTRSSWATATIGIAAFRSPRVRAEVEAADAHNDLRRANKKATKADLKWEKKVYTTDGAVAVHNAMADHFNERIGAINDKPKYKDLNLNLRPNDPISKEYEKEVHDLTMTGYREAVKSVHGSSPSGKKQAVLGEDGESIKIVDTDRKVKHAAEDDEDIEFLLRRDDDFRIVEMNKAEAIKLSSPEDSMAQTVELGADFIKHFGSVSDIGSKFIIEHFGIKGMRWGVRREGAVTTQTHIDTGIVRRRTQVQAKGGEAHPAHDDAIKAAVQRRKLKKSGTAALSNQELRELASRIQLETQVSILTSSKGRRFVQKQVEEEGKQQFKKGATRAAPRVVRRVRRGAATGAAAAALVV